MSDVAELAMYSTEALNRIVAVDVFGFHLEKMPVGRDGRFGNGEVYIPSGADVVDMESYLPRIGPVPMDMFLKRWTTDSNAALEVLLVMANRDYYYEAHYAHDAHYWRFNGPRALVASFQRSDKLCLAICMAAVQAVRDNEGSKNEPA